MKKLIIHIIVLILFVSNQLTGQNKDGSLIDYAIKEFNIVFSSPAFLKANGYTNYNELVDYLKKEVYKKRNLARIEWIGESVKGKQIPAIVFEQNNNKKKIKIWMQGGLHGNEPASSESMLLFIQYLVNNPQLDTLFDRITLMIIPMANIDGYVNQSRYTAEGIDLNRDQTKLIASETVSLKKAFNNFAPHVAIDFHEYRPFRSELAKLSLGKVSIPYDVLFLPSGNLNIPGGIRTIVNELFIPGLKDTLMQYGLSSNYYFLPKTYENGELYLRMGGSSPRSSSSSFGLTNAASILFEIRGIGLGKQLFERRVFSGFILAKNVLEIAYSNSHKIDEVIEQSIKSTIELEEEIVIEAQPEKYEKEIQLLNIENDSLFQLKFNIEDANLSTAVKTRIRPEGYLLLPDCFEIAAKLKILGLEIDTIKHDSILLVEEYKITQLSNSDLSDKLLKVNISTEQNRKSRMFPNGSFIISTRQKNANVAISVLEPEMINGVIRLGLLDVSDEKEIPIYRILNRVYTKKIIN